MTESPVMPMCAIPRTHPAQTVEQLQARLSPETIVRGEEPLGRRTTLRVGGAADVYVEPASTAALATVAGYCAEHNLPWFVLGRGSNLLVKDEGFRGVVICLAHPHFGRIEVAGELLSCGAGARLKAVGIEAKRHGLAGLEFLEGIPGSVGGGLRMNAGAMGGEMFRIVESVRLMDSFGRLEERTPEQMQVAYRKCSTLETHIAVGAVLRGTPAPREQIEQRMKEFSQKRWSSQPAAPSAGCIFKNPVTISAGKLIDELGLKGTRIGGACVSVEHGNFIITDAQAKASDVLELIELIRRQARERRGIDLETEVEILGD